MCDNVVYIVIKLCFSFNLQSQCDSCFVYYESSVKFRIVMIKSILKHKKFFPAIKIFWASLGFMFVCVFVLKIFNGYRLTNNFLWLNSFIFRDIINLWINEWPKDFKCNTCSAIYLYNNVKKRKGYLLTKVFDIFD